MAYYNYIASSSINSRLKYQSWKSGNKVNNVTKREINTCSCLGPYYVVLLRSIYKSSYLRFYIAIFITHLATYLMTSGIVKYLPSWVSRITSWRYIIRYHILVPETWFSESYFDIFCISNWLDERGSDVCAGVLMCFLRCK